MSNLARETSRRIRHLTGWSQAILAQRLFISRNYVSLIEGGVKEPSARLLSQLQGLLTDVEKESSVNEDQAPYGQPQGGAAPRLKSEAKAYLDGIILAAGDDLNRLGWIIEQLGAHLRRPPHWGSHDTQKIIADAEKEGARRAALIPPSAHAVVQQTEREGQISGYRKVIAARRERKVAKGAP